MANHCYNLIQFLGNPKVKAQVKRWNTELKSYQPTKDDPYCMRAIREVFYPEFAKDAELDMGSKWVHPDEQSIGSDDDELGLQSAWDRPDNLERRLACLLYPLDKNVVVRNLFNIEDGSCGVSYTAAHDTENSYSQVAFVEVDEDYEGDIALEGADASEKLRIEEVNVLFDMFLDDMPHLKKVIKKHLPHLSKV
jgi:hypothetical protein